MNPIRKLKKMPEPSSKMIAKEKFPRSGIREYHSKLVGKSHRRSDSGPTNAKIPLIYSKIPCILDSPPTFSNLLNKLLVYTGYHVPNILS